MSAHHLYLSRQLSTESQGSTHCVVGGQVAEAPRRRVDGGLSIYLRVNPSGWVKELKDSQYSDNRNTYLKLLQNVNGVPNLV